MSLHGETCGNKGEFSLFFLPTLMIFLVKIFTGLIILYIKLWYTKCGPLDNTVYLSRHCKMGALSSRFCISTSSTALASFSHLLSAYMKYLGLLSNFKRWCFYLPNAETSQLIEASSFWLISGLLFIWHCGWASPISVSVS